MSLVDWSGRHADSSENASAFSSCVGGFEEAYSMSCGRSETDETPQTLSVEEAQRSPAESEVPGKEINTQR
jgi:hypothetical protein